MEKISVKDKSGIVNLNAKLIHDSSETIIFFNSKWNIDPWIVKHPLEDK